MYHKSEGEDPTHLVHCIPIFINDKKIDWNMWKMRKGCWLPNCLVINHGGGNGFVQKCLILSGKLFFFIFSSCSRLELFNNNNGWQCNKQNKCIIFNTQHHCNCISPETSALNISSLDTFSIQRPLPLERNCLQRTLISEKWNLLEFNFYC